MLIRFNTPEIKRLIVYDGDFSLVFWITFKGHWYSVSLNGSE